MIQWYMMGVLNPGFTLESSEKVFESMLMSSNLLNAIPKTQTIKENLINWTSSKLKISVYQKMK